MTREEAKSCIGTIELLRRLAYNIHGVMDVIDADNCEKIIKALEQEPKWIPVGERLPEEFTNVIVTDNETSNTYQSQYIGKGYWDCDNGYFRNRIVAWMPLPESYESQERSE